MSLWNIIEKPEKVTNLRIWKKSGFGSIHFQDRTIKNDPTEAKTLINHNNPI